jgi:putative addiction module CopG family antidote
MASGPTERLSVQVSPALKQSLSKQAKRAGLSLSEWVRTRLELEGTDPDEMRAFVREISKLRERLESSKAESEASKARSEAWERDMPARVAAIRAEVSREFDELGATIESHSNTRSAQQFCITLSNDMADVVRAKVADGEYATDSEVIREGLRSLMARDQAVEAWLRETVVPACDALKADPSRGMSVDQLQDALAEHRQQKVAGRRKTAAK